MYTVLLFVVDNITYVGLVLTLLVLWLLRGSTNGLQSHFRWLAAVWAGYILVELGYTVEWYGQAWYSLLRKVPGRVILAGSVMAFLIGVWRTKHRTNT